MRISILILGFERLRNENGDFHTSGIIGRLSNYDNDHKDDFKKTIGLMIKATVLHVHHAF